MQAVRSSARRGIGVQSARVRGSAGRSGGTA